MARKSRDRRRVEEHFALLPLSVLTSEAVKHLNDSAFRLLVCIVACPPDRNGRLMMSYSHARQFGFQSNDTIGRARKELVDHGLLVVTRAGRSHPVSRHGALYAVTWLPIHNRNGEPVVPPEPASHAYLKWTAPETEKRRSPPCPAVNSEAPIGPMVGPNEGEAVASDRPDGRAVATPCDEAADEKSPARWSGRHGPMIGPKGAPDRPDQGVVPANHRPDSRANSDISDEGPTLRAAGGDA